MRGEARGGWWRIDNVRTQFLKGHRLTGMTILLNAMLFGRLLPFIVLFVSPVRSLDRETQRPHIIMIVADDLGWNDVSFHGSNQIITPNIDSMAYDGIILNNYYVNPICSPSRSALLTGFHPIHTGMQHNVLNGPRPYGLPLKFELLPEYLNEIGYTSRAVGKWHLGFFRSSYTPTKRGFHSHFGYWCGCQDYYDHTFLFGTEWGYDLRRNLTVAWDGYGKYATDMYTDEAESIIHSHASRKTTPLFLYLAHLAVHSGNYYAPLQAPKEVVDRFSNIQDKSRRKFAGMLYKLDQSVGRVVEALEANGMLNNSVIIFTTDNGGPAAGFNQNAASNWPLKGTKDTLWEGGVRGSGFIWSPLLASTPRVSQQMMNIQDWLPTIYSAVGGKKGRLDPSMDGIDLWDALSKNPPSPSPRNLFLHNIDDDRGIQAVRVGDWKLVRGNSYQGRWDGWFGPSGREGSYDTSVLSKSRAAKALSRIGRSLPAMEDILRLRSSATVSCKTPVVKSRPCLIESEVCLFNVTADPCEFNNVAFDYPDVVRIMDSTLAMYRSTAVPPCNKPIDPNSNPKYHGYVWTYWLDVLDPQPSASPGNRQGV